MWVLLILSVALLLAIFKLKKVFSYWKDRGVENVAPLRYFESFNGNFFRTNATIDVLNKIYNEYPNKRYVGFYHLFEPVLIIRDLELIKRITVKDYNAFWSHSSIISLDLDQFWSQNIVATDYESWTNLKTHLSPFFTSNKLKASFHALQIFSADLINYLHVTSNDNRIIDMKKIFKRYSNDVTAYNYFGVKCNSISNGTNEFIQMVDKAMALPITSGYTNIINKFCPKLLKLFGLKVFDKDVRSFFVDVMMQSIKFRFDNEFPDPDFIKTMIQMYDIKKSDVDILDQGTLDKVMAQAFIMVFSGYETVTTTLSLLVYELALNCDIQEKLHREIVETVELEGSVTYDAIMKMEYLDMVVNEVLRLHTPSSAIDRKANEDYVIEAEKPDEQDLLIEKGTSILILQTAIHMDPNYFPNPRTFDPERFGSKNKQSIKHYSYIPFGVGPRSCLGYRYGVMEAKLVIADLLINFELLPTEKTYVEDAHKTYNVRDYGIWVELRSRIR